MKLHWDIIKDCTPAESAASEDTAHALHLCEFKGESDRDVQLAINTSIDKACDLLEQNIQDDSRYLLFEWNAKASTLTIVVTDDGKERDSREVVQCHFAANDIALNPDDIQFWIRDYLTTCTQFLHYSLIAAFHRDSRADCTLL